MVLALSAGEAISANGANREALLSIINSKYRRGVISFSDWRNKSRRCLRNKGCGKHHLNMFTNKNGLKVIFKPFFVAQMREVATFAKRKRKIAWFVPHALPKIR